MVKRVKHRNRRVAALLAIVVVGMFGAHKFYMGNKQAGVVHIIAFIVAIFLSNAIGILLPFMAVAIFSCVEGVIYALKTDEQFEKEYIEEKRAFL